MSVDVMQCPRFPDDTTPPEEGFEAAHKTIPAPPPCAEDDAEPFVLRPLSFGLPPPPDSLSAWDGFASEALDEEEGA